MFSKKSLSSHFLNTKQYPDTSDNLEFQQLLEAGHSLDYVIFGNLIIGSITIFIMLNDLPKTLLGFWIALLAISILLRIVLASTYQKARPETLRRWKGYFISSSLFSGIIWGIGALFIEFHTGPFYHGIEAFILGGLSAGAIVSNSFIRWNYPAFMLPMLSLLTISYLYQNDIEYSLMAMMVVTFMIIMGVSAANFRKLHFEKQKMLQIANETLDQLQVSEQRLKDITSSMGEGVFVVDKTGHLTFINNETERLLGWHFEELNGDLEDIHSKIHVHMQEDQEDCPVKRALAYGLTLRSDNELFKRKDGTLFPVLLTVAPLHSKDGTHEGAVVLFQDNTRQKELENKLAKLALHDALTGLYNRGHFDQKLQEELNRTLRYGRSLSLLMLDIDFFKKVNDTYGHQAGDEVLKNIAHIILSSIRNSDYAARYGGEEFAIILPETDPTEAVQLAERIRTAIEQNKFKTSENDIPITISIGVGTSKKETTPELLIEAADSALYQAKENGRNQVVCA
ncbi:MAG: GGDEF domain-containing protein [Campylobacterales bacterium]|nr:GGDEF domain-containing protein [Campylobacterales bacterium]